MLNLLKILVFETIYSYSKNIEIIRHISEQLLLGLEERLVLLSVVAGASVLGAGLRGLDGLYNQTPNKTLFFISFWLQEYSKETDHSRKIASLSKQKMVKFTLFTWIQL